jgi:hypothetical protein
MGNFLCKCGQSPAKARTGPVAPRKTRPPRRLPSGSTSAPSAPSPPGSQPWSPSYRIPEFLISRFPRLDSRLSGFPHSSETRAEPRNTRKARNRAGGSRNTRKTRKLPRPSLRDLGFFSVTSVTTDWSAFARNPELLISRFTRLVSRLSGFPHPPPTASARSDCLSVTSVSRGLAFLIPASVQTATTHRSRVLTSTVRIFSAGSFSAVATARR